MYVEIGGIKQWLEIEGDSESPVLLLVHGGPGASTRFASGAWAPWREHFTLVHWDQRGAGRTFLKNGAENCQPMAFDRIVEDGLEVTEFLCGHLMKERIFVLGHSWGSAIAVHMVKRQPDRFAAFVGTGMLVNFQENEVLKPRQADPPGRRERRCRRTRDATGDRASAVRRHPAPWRCEAIGRPAAGRPKR